MCNKFLLLLIVSSATANKISEANNRFTPDIYKELVKNDRGNILFSSLSAEAVLALLHSGTKGETAQELAKTLYLPEDEEEIQTETKTLLTRLQNPQFATFEIANGIFIQEGFNVRRSFLEVASEDFFATAQNLNFGQTQDAADQINKYVEDHTNRTIKHVVDPDDLSGTSMILVNALHLKADWLYQFSQQKTKSEEFFLTPLDSIDVDFLHLTKNFNYCLSDTLRAEFLEMRFREEEAALVIVLPEDHASLPLLEEHISEIFSLPFEVTNLNVALPKFSFEYEIDFKTILQSLGVTKIFNSDADLSGIAGQRGDLLVNQVIQKAFIDVNEGGVEASAATVVGIGRSVDIEASQDFIVNRPFIFFIRYKGVIVFVGKIVEPKS